MEILLIINPLRTNFLFQNIFSIYLRISAVIEHK